MLDPVRRNINLRVILILVLCLVGGYAAGGYPWSGVTGFIQETVWKAKLMVALRSLEPRVLPAVRAPFDHAGIPFPPRSLTLVGLKSERMLEVWSEKSGRPVLVRRYPVLAASGRPGPKLREGDGQVPEGIYRITFLNPESRFHLSMRLNYPNSQDLERAVEEGRNEPGSDINIHGKAESTGCLAIGDDAIEELFFLTAQTGIENVRVIIAPNDFRRTGPITDFGSVPQWTPRLYDQIRSELMPLRGAESALR